MFKEIRGQVLVWCVSVAAASMQTIEARAGDNTGNDLLLKCQAVTGSNMGYWRSKHAVEAGIAAGECTGTLDTIMGLASLVTDNTKIFHICTPKSFAYTNMQAAMIFENYARQHPERLSYPAAWVAIEAVQHAYPCEKNGK
jgi:hypothetical protein